MLKFNSNEALRIIKTASIVHDKRRRARSLVKLAKTLNEGFEKQAFLSAAAITAIVSALASAGYIGYDVYSDAKERATAQEELAKLRENLQTQQDEKLKTLRPRVFMASPKQQSAAPPQPQAPKPPQPAPAAPTMYESPKDYFSPPQPQGPSSMEELFKSMPSSGPMPWGSNLAAALATPKYSSMDPMEKQAVVGSAIAAFARALLKMGTGAAKRVGKKMLSRTSRQMLRHGARSGARGTAKQWGRVVGGAKSGLGDLLQRISPGPKGVAGRVGRYGSRLAQRGARIAQSPTAYGRMAGRKLLGKGLGGAQTLGQIQLMGHGWDYLSPEGETPQYSDEEMEQAAQLMGMMEQPQPNGLQTAGGQPMSLPNFDITEIPMGEQDAFDTNAG